MTASFSVKRDPRDLIREMWCVKRDRGSPPFTILLDLLHITVDRIVLILLIWKSQSQRIFFPLAVIANSFRLLGTFRFLDDLKCIALTILDRNKKRQVVYEYLNPSRSSNKWTVMTKQWKGLHHSIDWLVDCHWLTYIGEGREGVTSLRFALDKQLKTTCFSSFLKLASSC